MGHLRSQVVLQGASNLPEDRFINVFNFDTGATAVETHALLVDQALANFYGATDRVPAGFGLAPHFSQYVIRPFTIRHYDMADPEPRIPVVSTHTLMAYSATSGLRDMPEEVAVVLSLAGAPPVTGRRRGRLYIGPLNNDCATDASTSLPTRVTSGFRTLLATEAGTLVDTDLGWSIWSPTSSTLVPIVGGFIDDAFDTQRRRGPVSTTRTLWPLP